MMEAHHLYIFDSVRAAREHALAEPPHIQTFTIWSDGARYCWGSAEAAQRFGFTRVIEVWREGRELDA
jgi:hypothetical protein